MEQTKALNALEPFVALTKSATSPRAAADLITRATSTPTAYLFTELLSTPQIQALAQSADYAPYLTLLQLFSYGTYDAYQATPGLPALNDVQTLKLRQLSLLTLARDRSNLTYEKLQAALGLSSSRSLEDLVISTIYAGLLDATLDPYRKAVQVNSVAPLRDLAPDAIPPMIVALQAWSTRCTDTLADLEGEIAKIKSNAALRAREKVVWDAKLAKLVEDLENPAGGNNSSAMATAAALQGAGSGAGPEFLAGGATTGDRKLAVGVGSAILRGGNAVAGTMASAGAGPKVAGSQRYGKRGSGVMDASSQDIDDEAMDLDDEDDEESKKRASRRKL